MNRTRTKPGHFPDNVRGHSADGQDTPPKGVSVASSGLRLSRVRVLIAPWRKNQNNYF